MFAAIVKFHSIFLLILTAPALFAEPANVDQARSAQKSLVRVSSTTQSPDYSIPWNPGSTSGGRGAGFVIDGNRIMTNAHVVSDARFIAVDREGDPKQYTARVEHVAHDCDLAVLRLEDESFFEGMEALEFGGIPELESTVSAYGYPIGGDRMSVTQGVVSRIDFQPYSHSGIDSHLTIQIDAAINPGNSGGPVMQDGKVVGVAFQGFRGDVAQNTGYMIPVPVVERFLTDIKSGEYNRYVELAISTFNLTNPAMRTALGLENDDLGIMVGSVYSGGSSDGVLESGDVLMAIDGLPIFSDGFVVLDGQRIEMPEVVERKFVGDKVTFDILRDGERKQVSAELQNGWMFASQANAYDEKPRYVIFGGLVFQPVSSNFLAANRVNDLRLQYLFQQFVTEEVYVEHPELIVLSNILADPVNSFLTEFQHAIVDEVNDQKIRTLEDLAAAFEKDTEYHVIRTLGDTRPLVLATRDVEAARERILSRYSIPSESNLTK